MTLRRPFRGANHAEVQKHVCFTDPVPPDELVADLPRDLGAICLKALQKDPVDRYQDAGEFARDLRCWLNDEAITIRRPTVWEKTRRWVRRNRVAARVGGVFLMLLIAVGSALGWVAWQKHEQVREARFSETLTQERALLQARNAATAKAFGLLTLARQRVDTPTQGRRFETQAILRDAAKLGRQIEPGETAVRFSVEVRSLFAATLAVPDIELPLGVAIVHAGRTDCVLAKLARGAPPRRQDSRHRHRQRTSEMGTRRTRGASSRSGPHETTSRCPIQP